MKHTVAKPTVTAPTKRPVGPPSLGLNFASLAGLQPAPARPAPALAASKLVPAVNALPKRITAKPATTAAPALKCPSFDHLAGAAIDGPLLVLAITPAPAPAQPDSAAIAANWDLAHRRASSFLPVAQAGRDAAACRWDELMQSAVG